MIRLLVCLFLLSSFNSLEAQEKWPLQKCIEQAVASSINAQLSSLNIDNAEINATAATHARYPSLNANSNMNFNFGRTVDPTTNEFNTETFFSNNHSLSTGITVYDGGRISKTIAQSKELTKASIADHDQIIRNTSLTVASNYLNALFALENKRISENQLALSEKQLNQINVLIESGSRPKNEALDITAQIARDKQSIIQAENNYTNSILQLKQLLRLDLNKEIELVVPDLNDFETTNPLLVNFDEVYETALITRPDIAAGEHRLESSVIGKKIASAGKMPRLTLGGQLATNYSNKGISLLGSEDVLVNAPVFIDDIPSTLGVVQNFPIVEDANYSTQLQDNLSYGFGIGLNIPIYNNYSVKASEERAELDIIQNKLNNEQLKDNLKTTVQTSLTDARAAKLALEASETTLKAQRASFRNTETKYKLGAVNTFEFTSARNLLDNAEIDALISKYDYIFKLKILEFYMGKPIKLN